MTPAATLTMNPIETKGQPAALNITSRATLAGLPWLTIMLSLLALAAWCWPGAAEWLEYDRAAIGRGEFWRLLTGHGVHWNADQLVWNLAPFSMLGGLCERRGRRRTALALGLAALAIAASVWWGRPDLDQYRGLSGLDSALFALAGVCLLREKIAAREWAGVAALLLLGAGFIAKVGWEATRHATIFVASPGVMTPVWLAHAIGAACGLLVYPVKRTTNTRSEHGIN